MGYAGPASCGNGHELGPWRVTLHWCWCTCPAAVGGGHHQYRCNTCGHRQTPECVDRTLRRGFEPPKPV